MSSKITQNGLAPGASQSTGEIDGGLGLEGDGMASGAATDISDTFGFAFVLTSSDVDIVTAR